MDYISEIETCPTLYQDNTLLIKHLPRQEALFYKVTGYLDDDAADSFFKQVLEATETTKARNIVADLIDFKGGNLNLAKYMNQIWTQKLANLGISRLAFNKPTSRFGQFMNKIAAGREANALLEIREFKSLNAAFKWIEKEEKKG